MRVPNHHVHAGSSPCAFTPVMRLESESKLRWPTAPYRTGVAEAECAVPGSGVSRTAPAVVSASRASALRALHAAAVAHGVPLLADDQVVSIGAGAHGRSWPLDALPAPEQVPWAQLQAVPTALIAGSRGKTSMVRLLAALLRAHGWITAHSCTEGVYVQQHRVDDGVDDAGARAALRQPAAQAAVLELAPGGTRRHDQAYYRADAVVVTNVCGGDETAAYDPPVAELSAMRMLGPQGLLVLNADDAALHRQAQRLQASIGWFALHYDTPALVAHRAVGGVTCGVQHGELLLGDGSQEVSLGDVAKMPLSLKGRAVCNIRNLAAAALAAQTMGVPAVTIARVFACFGGQRGDNPGRLQPWAFDRLRVVLDYAHDAEDLHEVLQALGTYHRRGGFAIALAAAGSRRGDAGLRALAATVARFQPNRVIVSQAGAGAAAAGNDVAAIMHAALRAGGVAAEAIQVGADDEADVARRLLAQALDGDLVVLPIQAADARRRVMALLEAMDACHWHPGQPLPQG